MTARRRVLSVVGTRPNLMKMAPVGAALERLPDEFDPILVHTGQHYDREMSQIFLEELGLGEPHHFLGVGSGSHSQQMARVMERLEPVLLQAHPEIVLVPGDVTSTAAAALVAAKLGIAVGHVEAGLRSFARTMPEELNRIVADHLSDYLFIHSPEARDNLLTEGRPQEHVHAVGNTMIDTLVAMGERIRARAACEERGLERGGYLVVTLHRPALVDGALLPEVVERLSLLSQQLPVLFPVHPRTQAEIDVRGLRTDASSLHLTEPLGYLEFLSLVADAAGVLTDSGGIQEETTFLGVPCFTLRDNTERPITCELGTNTLLGLAPARIAEIPALIASAGGRSTSVPPLWDGSAANRLVEVLLE